MLTSMIGTVWSRQHSELRHTQYRYSHIYLSTSMGIYRTVHSRERIFEHAVYVPEFYIPRLFLSPDICIEMLQITIRSLEYTCIVQYREHEKNSHPGALRPRWTVPVGAEKIEVLRNADRETREEGR